MTEEPAESFSVFISYASEDGAQAERLLRALRVAGLDVWLDTEELRGGDAWDEMIHRRIKQCTFFVPLISESTQAREEGYFRREWRLAVDRTHDMADDRPFIVPVSLTAMRAERARVPKAFLDRQWLHLPDGADGERLAAELRRLHGKVTTGPAPDPAAPRIPPPGPPRTATPSRLLPWGIVSAFAAVVAAALIFALRPVSPGAASTSDSGRPDPHSVAVLPLANVGGEAKDEYLSDGLTEELMAALGRDSALHVVARTSSFAFKGRDRPVQEIASILHVATLVEGSVRRQDDQLKIIIQLVDARTGYQTWSREYERQLVDLFAIQSALADDVARQLLPSVSHLPDARPGTRNLDAYDAYLHGRAYQVRPPAKENLDTAIAYYEQAVRSDPNYARAWAGRGTELIRRHTMGYDDSAENVSLARQAIGRALELDPDLPEAHAALADFYTVNFTQQALAAQQLLLALRGAPNDPDVLRALASTHLNRGHAEATLPFIRQAALIDPQNADVANFNALALDFASHYPEAIAERERAFAIGSWPVSLMDKAGTYRNWKGDLGLALRTLDEAEPVTKDPSDLNTYWRIRATFLRAQHTYAGALAAVDRITTESLPAQYYLHSRALLRAGIWEARGDLDRARVYYTAALAPAESYRRDHPGILRAYTSLALIYAGLGREPEARSTVARCLELVPPDENPYTASRTGLRVRAQIDARFGAIDTALATVRDQIRKGLWKRNDLRLDPDWELLRRDPRFLSLAAGAPL